MTRWKKAGLWLVTLVAILSVLLFSVGFLLTRTGALEPLRETLRAKLCQDGTCQLDFENLEILLFPSPHAVASNVRVTLPGKLTGTVESVSVFPRILQLLAGRVEFARLRLISPKVEITVPDVSARDASMETLSEDLPDESSNAGATAHHFESGTRDVPRSTGSQAQSLSFSRLQANPLSLLALLSEKAPGLHLQVEHGHIDIVRGARRLISLQELTADLSMPPKLLRVKIECASDHWQKLAIDGWFDPVEGTTKGRVMLTHFRTQQLAAYLPATVPRPVEESPIDLEVSFSREGPEVLNIEFKGSTPSITLQREHRKSFIRNLALEGALHTEAGKLEIRLSSLIIKSPQLNLTGRFSIDASIPEASYHLECRDTNAAEVREVALALAGESEVVRDIFEIIRGGTVPQAIFQARGASTRELQDSESLILKGSLQNGEVFVPKVDLRVNDVFGEVHISRDVLEGRDLRGRTDATTGRNGSLTVALSGEDGPFHLDIEIDADLSQLPPVLMRVVDSKAFQKELAKVQDISGKAKGKLILGETLEAISARVEVNEWNLKGSYQGFPFPLELAAGSFFYEGSSIAIGSLRGSSGKSELFELSGSLEWSQGPYLQLAPSTRAQISLDELFPWLITLPRVSDNRWDVRSLGGTLLIDSLDFKGLLSRPDDWHFLGDFRVEELTCRTGLLPDTLRVKTGAFRATPQSLTAKKCDSTCLDASLVISGKFTGYRTDLRTADVTLRGDIGPQAGQWFSELFHLPPDFRLRTPLSTQQTSLNWAQKAQTRLAGDFRVKGGPDVTINLDQGPRELSINQLSIRDQDSNATLAITIREGEFGFAFKGDLTAGTMDRLFTGNQLFGGSLAGDLSARVIFDQLASSTADGQLSVKELWYAPKQAARLALQDASLVAKGNSLEIKTATFRAMDTPMDLKGSVGVTDNQLQLDLDLRADGIDGNKLKELYPLEKTGGPNPGKPTKGGETFQDLPIRGNLRIDTGYFIYDEFRWEPLRANLLFAPDGINIQVTEANLCNIPTPATIFPSNAGPLLVINLDARGLDLDPAISCLWNRQGIITGAFNLEGEITAKIQQRKMNETIQGNLNLIAWNGRVYRSTVLAKIFDLLNFTEIYRGRLPDLAHEGCAYDSLRARLALKNGKILVEDAVFDGRCAKLVGTGEIDPQGRKMDLTILVSPLKTVDTLVRHIPLVGHLLGGSLVSIPVRVTGNLSDPSVIPLSPSAVGSGLVGTMKRVFQLPLTLIQPLD